MFFSLKTATGTVDAVLEGKTGLLVDIGQIDKLTDSLLTYIRDPKLRHAHGEAARVRVVNEFDPQIIFALWDRFYHHQSGRVWSPAGGELETPKVA